MNQPGPPAEFLLGMLVCIAVVFAVVLIIYIFFLLTLYRTQKEVAERNREIAPGLVWLTLIPLFSTFWVLYMVPKLASSLRREFEDRGWRTVDEGFGRTTGLIWAWGGIVSLLLSAAQNAVQFAGVMEVAMLISLLSLPISLAILVCWIMYWVQMYQYGKRLREGERGYRSGSLEEDYDDDRPRGRRDEDDYDRDRYDDEPRRRDRDEY
jgi:hypothetical protein